MNVACLQLYIQHVKPRNESVNLLAQWVIVASKNGNFGHERVKNFKNNSKLTSAFHQNMAQLTFKSILQKHVFYFVICGPWFLCSSSKYLFSLLVSIHCSENLVAHQHNYSKPIIFIVILASCVLVFILLTYQNNETFSWVSTEIYWSTSYLRIYGQEMYCLEKKSKDDFFLEIISKLLSLNVQWQNFNVRHNTRCTDDSYIMKGRFVKAKFARNSACVKTNLVIYSWTFWLYMTV